MVVLITASSLAQAQCADPVGGTAVAGQFRYMTDYKEFRHCDGNYWQSMATRTSIAGSCTAGTMAVASGDLRMCNGTTWLSMTGATGVTCTGADGSLAYDSASKQMKLCSSGISRTVGLAPSDSVAVISTANPYLQVYDVSSGSLRSAPSTLPSSIPYAIAYSPSGSHLAVGTDLSPYIMVYNVSTMTLATVASIPSTAMSFSFKPDGTRLAAGLFVSPYFTVYDTSTWTRLSLANVPAAPGIVYGASYSPDGNLIATIGDTSPYLVFYNASSLPYTKPNLVSAGNLPGSSGEAIAFSPNGRYLALGLDFSPFVVVYRTSDWTKVTLGSQPTDTVRALAWHPDSSKLVVGQISSPYLQVYDTTTWAKSTPFSSQPGGQILGIAFNSRGTVMGASFETNTPPNYFSYETYGWTKLSNVLTSPAVVGGNRVCFGVNFRPGQ